MKVEVHPINDSEKAVSMINQEKFDGIFLDLEMPNLSGFDLAHLLHGVPLVPTGHDDNGSRFVPGRLANQASKIEAAQVGHFQVQENSVKLLLIDHADRFLDAMMCGSIGRGLHVYESGGTSDQ